jgi:hypothetical protein
MSSCDISLVAVWPDQRQFTIMNRLAYNELPNRTVTWLRFVGTWILGSVFSPSSFRLFDTLHGDAPCAEVASNGSPAIIPCISGENRFFYLHVEGEPCLFVAAVLANCLQLRLGPIPKLHGWYW